MQPIQTRTLWLPIKRASENPRGRRSQAKPAKVKRLKALAFALGVKRIIATRNLTISVSLQGLYFGEGSLTAEEARGWGLSKKQGGFNGSTQHPARTHLALKTKAEIAR
jgi:hypothetical protein